MWWRSAKKKLQPRFSLDSLSIRQTIRKRELENERNRRAPFVHRRSPERRSRRRRRSRLFPPRNLSLFSFGLRSQQQRPPQPLPDLTKLFLENYNHLNSALDATDHSWTSLTLKLGTALNTTNKLVQCTNTNVASLLEKVEELQKIVKRWDSAIAAAKAFYVAPDNHSGSFK